MSEVAYLNLDVNFFEHPKTRRLVSLLGPNSDILPLRLWAYCAKYHPLDGRLKGYSETEIEGIIGWTGEPGLALKSMGRVGFILGQETGYQCVDWLQHEGHIAAFSRRGKTAAKARWSKYATSMPKALQNGTSSNAPTIPNHTIPNHTIPNLTIPTLAEVTAYCLERKNGVNPEAWINHYQAKGWMIGKSKMKDWKAAVRTWEKNNPIPSPITAKDYLDKISQDNSKIMGAIK